MFTMFHPILSKRSHPDPLEQVRIILVVRSGPELPQIGTFDLTPVHTMNNYYHGGSDSTVIKRRQQQLGRMADFLPSVTYSVFDL